MCVFVLYAHMTKSVMFLLSFAHVSACAPVPYVRPTIVKKGLLLVCYESSAIIFPHLRRR